MIYVLKKIFKYFVITLLILFLAGASALFLLRDRDMGTEFLKKQMISAARTAGYHVSIDKLAGNPIRGYEIEGLSVSVEDALSMNMGTFRIALSYDTLLKGKFVAPVIIRNGVIELIDHSKLPKKDPPEKEGSIWFPYIPVEIRNLTIRYPEIVSDILLRSADLGISPEKINASVDGYIGDKPLRSELVMDMSEDNIALSLFRTTFNKKSILEAKGNITPYFSIEGSITSLDLGSFTSLLPEKKRPDIRGTVNFNFSLAGNPEDPFFKGDLDIEEPALQNIGIRRVRGNISYDGSLFLLSSLKADMLDSILNADLSLSEKGNIDLSFSAKNLDLSKLENVGNQLPETRGIIEELEGDVSGDLQNLLGKIYARSGSISIMDQEITNTELDIEFEGKTVSINSDLHWKGEPFSTRGTVMLGDEPSLDLLTSVRNFDIANIRPFLPAETAAQIPTGKFDMTARTTGSVKDPSVQLDLSSPSLVLNDEKITNIKADLQYQKPDMIIRELSCLVPEGRLSGSGKIALDKSSRTDIRITTSTGDISKTLRLVPSPPNGISGSAEAVISIKGKIDDPNISGSFKTGNFRVQSLFQAESIDGNFSFRNQRLVLAVNSPVALISRLLANKLNAEVEWQPGRLDIMEGSAQLLGGTFSSSGHVLLSQKPELDLSGNFENLALEKLPWKIPVDIEGETYGEFSVSGTADEPVIAFGIHSPNLITEGTTLDNLIIQGDFKKRILDLKAIFAQIGKADIEGNATIDLEKGFETDFKLAGTKLDIPFLLRNMEGNLKNIITGKINLDINGQYRPGLILARGIISSEVLAFNDLKIKDLYCPVVINGTSIEIPGMNASVYSGDLKSMAIMDLDDMSWEGNLSVTSMDLGKTAEDQEDIPVKLSGKGDMNLKVRGRGSDLFSIFGTGDLLVTDGDIGGLSAIEAAASTTNRKTIPFRRIRSNFLIDGFGVTILAGSRVEAPLRDPLYQYLGIDGDIQYDGKIDIEGDTKVNLQALNAFLGGLQTALKVTLARADLLSDIMGGLVGKVGKKDYRQVDFHIQGTRESPAITKLEVTGGEEYLSDLINIDEFREEDEEENSRQVEIKLNFPVGKGSEKESESTGQQFKEQLIEGILKSLSPAE